LKNFYKIFIVSMAFVLIAAACSTKEESKQDAHHGAHLDSDLYETTASVDELPKFLTSQPKEVRTVYQLAAQIEDILQWIPCYCGCGESQGHQSNFNCFIRDISEDGTVVWTDHGTRCGVCLQIAVQSAEMKQNGATNKEIRNFIDDTYKTGYAKPTDTKMPM
jgi:bacterioferritin-associated ferredoxin